MPRVLTATPIIRSTIILEGYGAILQFARLSAQHFYLCAGRLFAIGGDGHLTLRNATIKGFLARGGDGQSGGGGGMGAGGVAYIQAGGSFTVENCTFQGNSAVGGNGGESSATMGLGGGGGGIGGNGGSTDSDGLGYILDGVSGGAGGGGSLGAGDSIGETSYGGTGAAPRLTLGPTAVGPEALAISRNQARPGATHRVREGAEAEGAKALTLAAPTEGLAITVEAVEAVPSKAGMAELADLVVVAAQAGPVSSAGLTEDKAGSAAGVGLLMMGTSLVHRILEMVVPTAATRTPPMAEEERHSVASSLTTAERSSSPTVSLRATR